MSSGHREHVEKILWHKTCGFYHATLC